MNLILTPSHNLYSYAARNIAAEVSRVDLTATGHAIRQKIRPKLKLVMGLVNQPDQLTPPRRAANPKAQARLHRVRDATFRANTSVTTAPAWDTNQIHTAV